MADADPLVTGRRACSIASAVRFVDLFPATAIPAALREDRRRCIRAAFFCAGVAARR